MAYWVVYIAPCSLFHAVHTFFSPLLCLSIIFMLYLSDEVHQVLMLVLFKLILMGGRLRVKGGKLYTVQSSEKTKRNNTVQCEVSHTLNYFPFCIHFIVSFH